MAKANEQELNLDAIGLLARACGRKRPVFRTPGPEHQNQHQGTSQLQHRNLRGDLRATSASSLPASLGREIYRASAPGSPGSMTSTELAWSHSDGHQCVRW